MKHIIIIGFMGTGKTMIGKKLALAINKDFVDIDQEIEKMAEMKINNIFKEKGEEYFRNVEETTLVQVISRKNQTVISTGGGIVLKADNQALMKKHYIILLEASPEEIFRRLKDDKERPLLNVDNMAEEIKRIYSQREKLYKRMANITINTNNKSTNNIVKEIINTTPSKVLQSLF